METALFYFFSTLAQSFAALTAFFFAAVQVRISWIDEKITSTKKATLYALYGSSPYAADKVEPGMCKFSASEVVRQGIEKTNNESHIFANNLAEYIKQMQDLRLGIKKFVIAGMGITALGIIGIPLSPLISKSLVCSAITMGTITILVCIVLTFMGKFIYDSLEVSLKRDIH